jgi:hypothetical protein
MKKLILSLIVSVFTISNQAQELQKVYSIVKERQEISWYLVQKDLWEKETEKNKKNGDAWYNYYEATRALRNLHWEEKEFYEKYQKECGEITKMAYKAAPESFEANHLMWRVAGNIAHDNSQSLKYLHKAYEIRPNDSRVLIDMMTQAELEGDLENYTSYAKQYYKLNDTPARILNWAYNILSEVDKNAIVFTAGDNDTYATWLVQEAKSYRKDVKIINTSLILLDEYRNLKFKELGIPELKLSTENTKTNEENDKNREAVFAHILEQKNRSVYVSVSAAQQFTEKYSESLHLTGLAYKYSVEPLDNLSLLIRNFEKRYLMDHLKQSFTFTISEKIADNCDGLYLPGLTKLYKHYKGAEENQKAADTKQLLLEVAERCGKLESVLEIVK